jgi:hypothetical protein
LGTTNTQKTPNIRLRLISNIAKVIATLIASLPRLS